MVPVPECVENCPKKLNSIENDLMIPQCDENQLLVDNQCVDKCQDNQVLVEGICQEKTVI